MSHTVHIYSTPTCPWCKATKEFFKENKVEYEEFDVSSDMDRAQEMVEKSGQRGVPVIDVDGQIVVGFNKPRLVDLLGLK